MTVPVFVKKVFDKLYKYLWFSHAYSSKALCRRVKKEAAPRNIWLLGVPRSTNLGDHAQVLCSRRLFEEFWPDYRVFEFDSQQLMKDGCMLLDAIASVVTPRDLVFFQSGYNFTDMYPFQEEMHRAAAVRLRENKIVFLPQTISFQEPFAGNEFVRESLKTYREHGRVLLMCRDQKSLSIAEEALPGVQKMPFPDVVTTMIGRTRLEDTARQGVTLCVRNDEEGIYAEEDLRALQNDLAQIGPVDRIDTTLSAPSQFFIRRGREKYVTAMLRRMHGSKVVVTDRYHGLIFAVVANTPVVLLRTVDHKITEGLKWFPDQMRARMRLADSFENAVALAKELAQLPPEPAGDYFYREYYSKLRQIVNDIR